MMLEEKKKKAVENENYDDAKVINEKIKKLRDSEGGGPNFSTRPSGTPSDYYRQKKPIAYEEPEEEEPSISPMTYQKPVQQPTPQRRSPPKMLPEDERPINVKNSNPYDNAEEEPAEYAANSEPTGVQPLSK